MTYEQLLDKIRQYYLQHNVQPKHKELWNPNFQ